MFLKQALKIRRISKPLLIFLGVIVIVGVVLVFGKVNAGWNLDEIAEEAVLSAMGYVAQVIIEFLGWLLGIVLDLFLGIAQFNNFVNNQAPPAVHIGWSVVRDFSNMLFVIGLMIIAFGTILKIQTYHARSALVKLIIMAVLINFSKTITGVLIDFSQVVMMAFVNAFKDSAPIVITISLNLKEMISLSKATEGAITFGGVIVSLILAIALLIVAGTVIFAMGAVLLMRILMLWVLVILSPIAYIATVLPNTQKYASSWWSSLGKNLISGPLLAFFVWLALSIISTSNAQPIPLLTSTAELPQGASGIMSTQKIFNYVISIALLIMGLMMTQSLGVMGGSFAGSMVGKLKNMGVSTLKSPLKLGAWGARKIKAGALPGGLLKGVDFNPASIARTMRAGFAKKKYDEETKGIIAAGERLDKGGFRGMLGGLGAAGWVENHAQGFLYQKGIRRALGKGSQGRIDKLSKDRDEKQKEADELKESAEEQNPVEVYHELQKQRINESKGEAASIQSEIDGINAKADQPFNEAKELRANADKKEKVAQAKFNKGEFSSLELQEQQKEAGDWRRQADKKEIEGNKYKSSQEYTDDQKKISELKKKRTAEEQNYTNIEMAIGNFNAQQHYATKDQNARNFLRKQAGNRDQEARRLARGGMTKNQLGNKEARINAINLEIGNLNADISNMKTMGQDTSAEEKRRAALVHEKSKAQEQIRKDIADPEDVKRNQELAKNLQQESIQLGRDADKQYISQEQKDDRSRQAGEKRKEVAATSKKLEEELSWKPIDFLAQQERRRREHEEARKYDTTNEDELIAYFNNALKRDNSTDAAAVTIQAANVGHINELINATQAKTNWYEDPETNKLTTEAKPGARVVFKSGDYLSSGVEGIHVFMKEVFADTLKYGKQAAMALENDLSNIAEERDHWTFGQAIGWKDGRFYQRGRPEQQARVYTERSKRDFENLYRRGNRLSIGTEEWIDQHDHSKGRKSIVNESTVRELVDKWPSLRGLITRGRFNASAAEHIMQHNSALINYIQKADKAHASPGDWKEVITNLRTLGGKEGDVRSMKQEIKNANELLKTLGLERGKY